MRQINALSEAHYEVFSEKEGFRYPHFVYVGKILISTQIVLMKGFFAKEGTEYRVPFYSVAGSKRTDFTFDNRRA